MWAFANTLSKHVTGGSYDLRRVEYAQWRAISMIYVAHEVRKDSGK